ncbi:MAG: hypothetical protein SFX19_10330 [Alphaproteobacteria bacterium]|nr:hypothetical protein [Alphaproteobacteria bacterium]
MTSVIITETSHTVSIAGESAAILASQPSISVVTVGIQGPQGAQGEAGPQGPAGSAGGGVTDGDKGDITISGGV